jgi:hypothetical protein
MRLFQSFTKQFWILFLNKIGKILDMVYHIIFPFKNLFYQTILLLHFLFPKMHEMVPTPLSAFLKHLLNFTNVLLCLVMEVEPFLTQNPTLLFSKVSKS